MLGTTILEREEPASARLEWEAGPVQRILFVDDEAMICRLNREVLMDSGYEVDTAKDGAVAWATLQLSGYDLLITDNQMPKMTGLDLLKKLHAARMALPSIMLTGTFPQDEFTRQPWLRPAAMLLKPYDIAMLLGTVQGVLHARHRASAPLTPLLEEQGRSWLTASPM